MNFKLAFFTAFALHVLIISSIILIFKASENTTAISKISAIKIHLNLGVSKVDQAGNNQFIKSPQGRGAPISDNNVSKHRSEASSYDKKNQNELLMYLHESVQKNLVYPESAALLEQSGVVRLQFLLTSAGQIQDITLLKSSSYAELDRAAIKALQTIHLSNTIKYTESKLVLDVEFYNRP